MGGGARFAPAHNLPKPRKGTQGINGPGDLVYVATSEWNTKVIALNFESLMLENLQTGCKIVQVLNPTP